MKNILITLMGMLAVLVMPDLMAATDDNLVKRIEDWTKSLGAVGKLFIIVVGFAGAIFAFMGIIGLKKYAEDARQNPLMKPLIMFVAGAFALGFIGFTGMLSTTATQEKQEKDLFKK